MGVGELIRKSCFIGSLCWELPELGNPKPTSQIDCEPKRGPTHQPHFWRAYNWCRLWKSPTKLWFKGDPCSGKMSERRSGSYVESGFVGSSRGSTWREQRHKRCEDRDCE